MYFRVSPYFCQAFWPGYFYLTLQLYFLEPGKTSSALNPHQYNSKDKKGRDNFSKYAPGRTAQTLRAIATDSSGQNHQIGLSGEKKNSKEEKQLWLRCCYSNARETCSKHWSPSLLLWLENFWAIFSGYLKDSETLDSRILLGVFFQYLQIVLREFKQCAQLR